MLNQHGAVLAEHIAGSDRHFVAELDDKGMLVDCSVGLVHLLGRREKPLGVAFNELFASEQPDPSPVCPAVGCQVVYVKPPGIQTQLQVQVVRSVGAYLFVAEQVNLEQDVVERLSKLNDEMTNLMRELHKEKAELQHSIARIKRLEGIISICSYCHRIRNEQQSWQSLEAYLVDHSDAQFSHGICPGCLETHFGPHDD